MHIITGVQLSIINRIIFEHFVRGEVRDEDDEIIQQPFKFVQGRLCGFADDFGIKFASGIDHS